jgi:hypothetical protein
MQAFAQYYHKKTSQFFSEGTEKPVQQKKESNHLNKSWFDPFITYKHVRIAAKGY